MPIRLAYRTFHQPVWLSLAEHRKPAIKKGRKRPL